MFSRNLCKTTALKHEESRFLPILFHVLLPPCDYFAVLAHEAAKNQEKTKQIIFKFYIKIHQITKFYHSQSGNGAEQEIPVVL